ncbi:MAG: phosphoglycerate mutase family protein [Egibacteraceae bacterium]
MQTRNPTVTTVELVRHASAAARAEWTDRPDVERPLDAAGRAQARAIAEQLARGAPIAALHASPAVRCAQTIEPLAEATVLEVAAAEGLAEAATLPVLDGGDPWVAAAWLAGRTLRLLDELVAVHAGQRVVACSHGDVIPAVMAALVGRDGLDLADVRCRKGGRFTLTFDGDRCVDAVVSGAPEI